MKKITWYMAFCWLFWACHQSHLEMVEVKNDAGIVTEKYFRNKQNFGKEGIYQRFSDAGVLMEEAYFVNNVLEGERKFFYPNGKVEYIEPNVGGKIHGKYQKFDENGQLILEQNYQNGVLEGLSLAWYPNGTMKERVTMKNNEENGPFTEWHENGKIKAEGNYFTPDDDPDFSGDREHGELKLYDQNGELERIMDCKLGICKTRWERKS